MRKARILKVGASYHVTARFNRKEMILKNDENRQLFLTILAQARKKFKFRIENFCMMENHVHLLIEPDEKESLSKIMQWILGVFAIRFNRANLISGHVWGDRFFSRIISHIHDFLRTFKYIDYNPVEAGIVKFPGEWKFGGMHAHQIGDWDIIDVPTETILLNFPTHQLRASN